VRAHRFRRVRRHDAAVRLIHAAAYGGPYAGSFVPMLRAVLRRARERGHEVEAVFSEVARGREWLGDLERDGIAYRFASVADREVLTGELGRALGEADAPCVLHTHFSGFDIAAARVARARPRTAAIWHIHTPLKRGPVPWARNAVRFSLLSRGTSEILCVAPDLARAVRRRLAPPGRVTFLPNAIDTERFSPASRDDRLRARDLLELPADAPVLAHFGWDWHRKGGDLYLRAVARLVAEGRGELVALAVGGGDPTARLAHELGVEGHVRVLDSMPRVEDAYAAADVFVSPSRAEGMPYSVAEALASGTAVVASDIPGQRFICEGIRGCRLTALDESELAGALGDALDRDLEAAAAEAAEARAWVVENMDLRVWADALLERYEALVGHG
jgi:glycosyltransferase involved in cell wall biosynthesis